MMMTRTRMKLKPTGGAPRSKNSSKAKSQKVCARLSKARLRDSKQSFRNSTVCYFSTSVNAIKLTLLHGMI